MRPDELALAWPLIWIVEGPNAGKWRAEAAAWIAAQREQSGIVAVQCAFGTICGLFFFQVQPGRIPARLLIDRVISVDLFAPNRTLAAILRAARDLGEIHLCRHVRLLPPDPRSAQAVQGMAEVAARLGFMYEDRLWHLDLESPLRNVVKLPTLPKA